MNESYNANKNLVKKYEMDPESPENQGKAANGLYFSFEKLLECSSAEEIAGIEDAAEQRTFKELSQLIINSDIQESIAEILKIEKRFESKSKVSSTGSIEYLSAETALRTIRNTFNTQLALLLFSSEPVDKRLHNFKEKIQEAVDKNMPILEKHRGCKETVYKILSVVASICTAGVANWLTGKKWLFTASTHSEQVTKKLKTGIDSIKLDTIKPDDEEPDSGPKVKN